MDSEQQAMLKMQKKFGYKTLITSPEVIDDIEIVFDGESYIFEPGEPVMLPDDVANHALVKAVRYTRDELGGLGERFPLLMEWMAKDPAEDYPSESWAKSKMLHFCKDHNIEVKPKWGKGKIWGLIEACRTAARQGDLELKGVNGSKTRTNKPLQIGRRNKRK